ncbi:MAG: hypothetical protein C4K58_00205 [Flavobacteriaceae bacterium]|nr:MAG: hypothetical protein C4K58_00205 [Flavobacteriaceae bacterium]
MKNKYTFLVLFSFLTFFAHAQGFIERKSTKQTPLKAPTGQLLAGMAERDITPAILSRPQGRASVQPEKTIYGVRTRLKARTLVLVDKNGTSIALIQSDLLCGSLPVHHEIAEIIAKKTSIPVQNIAWLNTHTHSGPGGFNGSILYSKMAGAKPGIDPVYRQFLIDQIVASILEAYQNLRPAKIASGSIEVYKQSRNRAISAYLNNPENKSLDPNDPDLLFNAVNKDLTMLRVDVLDGGSYKPLGAFSIFGVHGTGVSAFVDVATADIFGFAQRGLAWKIKEEYKTPWQPIHGFATGAEGDVTPNLPKYPPGKYDQVPLDWPSVTQLGNNISDKSWELFESLGSQLKSDVLISSSVRELDLQENNSYEGVTICKKPLNGVSNLAGALDNRSSPIFNFIKTGEGLARKKNPILDDCQGRKPVPTSKVLIRLYLPPETYPKIAMFQLLQIGDLLLVPLPWEVTTISNKRITEAIAQQYIKSGKTPPKNITITSVANDYMGYATTPEEYDMQLYEGASTIYGYNTVPFITKHLEFLAKNLASGNQIADIPESMEIKMPQNLKLSPVKGASNITERKETSAPKFTPKDPSDFKSESFYSVTWTDVKPGDLALYQPYVYMERSRDNVSWSRFKKGLQPMDDEGNELEIRLVKDNKTYGEYMAKWYNPILEDGYSYRFVILPREGTGLPVLYSTVFKK